LIILPEGYKEVDLILVNNNNLLFIFTYESNEDSRIEPKWKVYGSILKEGSIQLDLFLIYQAPASVFMETISFRKCFYNNAKGFYFCYIGEQNRDLLVKVTFLSNGKIIDTKQDTDIDLDAVNGFFHTQKDEPYVIYKFAGSIFKSFNSGDSLIVTIHGDDWCTIFVESLDFEVNFNQTINTNTSCGLFDFNIMYNHTFLAFQEVKENYWTILTLDIPQSSIGNNLLYYLIRI